MGGKKNQKLISEGQMGRLVDPRVAEGSRVVPEWKVYCPERL